MGDNSSNDELRRAEMMRVSNDYISPAGANYQHLLPPQYFTQQMYYPYVNPYSHLTDGNLAIHGYGSDGRPKFRRSRTIFNPEQLDILQQHFDKFKYPDVKRRKMMSEEIGLPEERIQIWFQNRRAKNKRQMEQQVKLQKLVDEAIGGTQEGNRAQSNSESGSSVAFHNPGERQHDKMEGIQLDSEANHSKEEHSHVQYVDSKDIFPGGTSPMEKTVDSTSHCTRIESQEPQVAIQNIDQELLFKVATILSASNDATQLITDWSQSPNKLQTNSLEEQLRHFAEHHQKVLTDNGNTQSGKLPPNGLDKSL